MLKALNAAALSPGLLIASCGSLPATDPRSDIELLAVSEAYAQKHHPTYAPKGIERAWYVEDHGEIWTVEMLKQGTVGGGVKMGIRKADGRVLSSELTE